MASIGLPTIASEETTCLGVVHFPVFSAYPTELVTTVPIAACHVVTTIVLFDRRLALWTWPRVRLHPQPLSDIIKVDAVYGLLHDVDLSDFFRYLLLPLLKSFAINRPMHRF